MVTGRISTLLPMYCFAISSVKDVSLTYETFPWLVWNVKPTFLNIYHTDEERYDARFMLLKTYEGPDPGDTIWDRFSASHCHEDGYTIAEYSDLPGRVAKYIDERYPQNGLYAQVYLMSVVGYEVKEIAEMIGTDLQMTYYYQRTAYAVAREYRKKYFDEGQFTFPKDRPQKNTAAKRDKKGEKPDDTEEAM